MALDLCNLTNKSAADLLERIAISTFSKRGVSVEFIDGHTNSFIDETETCYCGEGDVISDIADVKMVYLGCSDMMLQDEVPVDMNLFTKVLVAINHEQKHVVQLQDTFQTTDDTAKNVALSFFSSIYPQSYHKQTYFHQSDEIQAEYYGVLNGYKQLLELTEDPKLSNRLICEYTNDRYDNNVSFLSRNDYTDVKDIFSDFRELFKKECRKHKDFNTEECSTNSDTEKSLLKLIQSTQNGNVQNAIAVRQLLAHFEKQGRDSNNWDNYNRFTALPVIKSLDLESSKLKNRIRSYFTLYPEGLDIKQVSIGDENYEREIIDLADNLSDNDSVKDI